MTTLATLPVAPDGCTPPIPVLCCWFGQLDPGTETIAIDVFAPGNAIIPELCQRFGVHRIVASHPDLPAAWAWLSTSGTAVTVADTDALVTDAHLSGHRGEVPPQPTRRRSTLATWRKLMHLVRLQDADRATDSAKRSNDLWPEILHLLAGEEVAALPPLADQQELADDAEALAAWNPLPIPRTGTLAIGLGQAIPPWSLCDARGGRHPVQVAEGALGRLVLSQLGLAANEAVLIRGDEDPASTGHWEVSTTTLDNGRVRAEFDERGGMTRLCCDGWFLPIAGPLGRILMNGSSVAVTARATVLEDGPVRARLSFEIDGGQGAAIITYSLDAGADHLQVDVTWHSQLHDQALISLPTGLRAEPVSWWAQEGPGHIGMAPQSTDGHARILAGCRAFALGWGHHPSLALWQISSRHALIEDGHIWLPIDGPTSFCLGRFDRASDDTHPLVRDLAGSVPIRLVTHAVTTPAFRLIDNDLLPIWIRRDSSGWIELTLTDLSGRQRRTSILLPGVSTPPQILADGDCCELPPGKDPDSWSLDVTAGAIILLRWQPCLIA